AVASRFPVALIAEFQDTDPLQFAIFSVIYQTRLGIEAHNSTAVEPKARSDSKLSLLMIGVPKQAIYAFRGADIYTY
ncbi:UvrD-helicase domain-containing protein, partial [Shewanella xiamenensis]|uniref:UvrD-helicase domain-containing protein n=1 Tax=Shewanella xiamenensis TaxID=332186 RepID=UPI0024A75839